MKRYVRVVATILLPAALLVALGTTAVSGSVGITGTPTVSLAGGSQVAIANTVTSPVLTRDVDGPASQPFNFSATLRVFWTIARILSGYGVVGVLLVPFLIIRLGKTGPLAEPPIRISLTR